MINYDYIYIYTVVGPPSYKLLCNPICRYISNNSSTCQGFPVGAWTLGAKSWGVA